MGTPKHEKKGSRPVGRLRRQAAEILSKALGFQVDPADVRPATGSWRTNITLDVFRWELLTHNESGMPVVAGCWETLTDFVKEAREHGCHINKNREIECGKEK